MRAITASHHVPADGCGAAREINSVLLEKKINRRIDVSSLADFQVSLERAASVLGQKDTQIRGIGHTFHPSRLASSLQCVRVF
jgi:hypothetical protein